MKRIAVLTRGGDAPGMNSVIRAIVRAGADRGLEVYCVRHGFNGPIIGDMQRLGPRDVSGSMQLARLLWPDHQRGVDLLAGCPRQP
ncbi:MAG: 6-phosphofructokinase [Anaerolineales bacterium]|nr:6-phosphofructokinase [Anaerolineales bacterium]